MFIFGQRKPRELKIARIIDGFIKHGNFDCYLEPFCGGCGVGQNIESNIHKIFSDIHEDLIMAWNALQNNWKLDCKINKTNYLQEKNQLPSARRGVMGYCGSSTGRFFDDFNEVSSLVTSRLISFKKDALKLSGSEFTVCDYSIIKPQNLIIYCDPPLEGTIYEDPFFDYNKFWWWVRYFSKDANNVILVSAHTAPMDFQCIQHYEAIDDKLPSEGVYRLND